MVLENVKEMWTEKPKGSKGKGVNKDRFISKMYVWLDLDRVETPRPLNSSFFPCGLLTIGSIRFLRGDSVILVLLS
jgi:hypothetical protein